MLFLGIDLGGTHIAVGIVKKDGEIILKESIPTYRERPYQEILKDMAMLSLKLIKDAGLDIKDINGIGVGSPGNPDKKKGLIVYSNNLNFKNVPVSAELQKYLELPVHLDNDANCAALAESVAGAARDAEHSVTITIGTGIGSGVVINKKIYSGFNYAAPEMGHSVIIHEGELCTCGRRGCWEAYASATALIRQTQIAAKNHPESLLNTFVGGDLNKVNGKTAFDVAKQGDAVAGEVVKRYINYLAGGLTNVVNIFEPEILVIGGGVCNQGEYLLAPVRKIVSEGVYSKEIPQTQIKVAQMGNDAGIIGAAMLCI